MFSNVVGLVPSCKDVYRRICAPLVLSVWSGVNTIS